MPGAAQPVPSSNTLLSSPLSPPKLKLPLRGGGRARGRRLLDLSFSCRPGSHSAGRLAATMAAIACPVTAIACRGESLSGCYRKKYKFNEKEIQRTCDTTEAGDDPIARQGRLALHLPGGAMARSCAHARNSRRSTRIGAPSPGRLLPHHFRFLLRGARHHLAAAPRTCSRRSTPASTQAAWGSSGSGDDDQPSKPRLVRFSLNGGRRRSRGGTQARLGLRDTGRNPSWGSR